ncbi:MAG: hypothetical protein LBP21_01715 [Synergistaceae bacterium]|jgi:hypothetical protein|nr:hypothetical protein [Synergistaceae bacterium]
MKGTKTNCTARGLVAAFLLCAILALTSSAHGQPMPDVLGEWRASLERVAELNAHGRWSNRVYTHQAPIAGVEVNLMEGPGPGTLFVPEGEVAANDAPLGFSSTYETLNVAGHRGILERGEILGQALAISLGKDRTLTLETKSLSREEFLSFAEKLTAALEGK